MKNKLQFTKITSYIFGCIYVGLLVVLIVTKNYHVALLQSIVTLIGVICVWIKVISLKKYMYQSLNQFIESFGSGKQNIINSFKLPVIMIKETGEIIWYNLVFRNSVLLGNDLFGENISIIIKDFNKDLLNKECKIMTKYKNRIYDVYISISKNKLEEDKNTYIMFFIDATQRNDLEIYIKDNTAVVIMVNIDNYEDMISNSSTSERNKIISDIEVVISNYFGAGNNGIVKRVEKDLFIIVQESKYIAEMINNKFSILDKVRVLSEDTKVPVTLSIGVGFGANNINESEQFAKQSLDMALGRGGDQAVIKRNDSFEFFGGLSSGRVKNTKVKTRIVASSLVELIEDSDNVIIMGHRFADLDCLGAAVGLVKGVQIIDDQKEVYIVIKQEENLAHSLLDKVLTDYDSNIFISPEEAGNYINKKTLLIIVDTHVKSVLESVEVYKSCKQVVIIDHHRKMVNHINNAIIFYHEPSASSTCEMITELLQYFNDKKGISDVEACALLSGIMLDTRNFVLKTGVRTFEAAAYLKKCGADTVEVKKLFSSSMEAYKRKTRLVSSAVIYKKCAISIANDFDEDLRVCAAQAADELLTINDIDASFVIYKYDGKVIMSARSMGTINVQIIMEYLGGGGHLTMAGVQLFNIDLIEANQKLLEAIDRYYSQ